MSQERAADAFAEALREDDPAMLYERAPCGYVSTTADGRIIKTNETFQIWTGYSAEQLTAMSFTDLLTVGGRIFHETHYRPMLRLQRVAREIALDVVRADGSRLPVLVNARMDLQQSAGVDVVRIAVFDATERRRYEQELVRAKQRAEASEERARALARTLQSSFIPPSVPTVPGLDVAGAYRPAADGTVVGGDFYDVFPVTRDEWVVVLGDVCGKGAEAAVVTSFVRDTVRVLSVSERSPARVLGRLNELLLRHAGADRYSTCVLVRLDRRGAGWHATVSVGGHPPPVVLRRGGDPAFAPFRGLLVGALPGAAFTDHEILLEPGDGLLLYTDGITEARAGEGFFGEERLLATLRGVASDGVAMDDVVSHLVGEALAFQAGNAHDDIAAVGLRVSAEPDPSDQERPAGSSPGR